MLHATEGSMLAAPSELGKGQENKKESISDVPEAKCVICINVEVGMVHMCQRERERERKRHNYWKTKSEKPVCSVLMLVRFLSSSE